MIKSCNYLTELTNKVEISEKILKDQSSRWLKNTLFGNLSVYPLYHSLNYLRRCNIILTCLRFFQLGLLTAASVPPPFPILWPTWHQYGLTLLRYIHFHLLLLFFLKAGFFGIFLSTLLNSALSHSSAAPQSDSAVSEDAGFQPITVATLALAVRRSNHSARSHRHLGL